MPFENQFSMSFSTSRNNGQLRIRIFISLRLTFPKKKKPKLKNEDEIFLKIFVLKSVNLIPSISQAGTFSRAKRGPPDLI